MQARGNLQPVASLIGGIAAQEALKAITHHTTPQKQFLYTHHLEALAGDYSPFDVSKLTVADCAPVSYSMAVLVLYPMLFSATAAMMLKPPSLAGASKRLYIRNAGLLWVSSVRGLHHQTINCLRRWCNRL